MLTSIAFDGGAALRETGSPQRLAFIWLLGNKGLEDFTEYNTIQRYALATLYYATGGENWVEDVDWLSDEPVCFWNSSAVQQGRCSDDASVLTGLGLVTNELKGTLPPEISHAKEIQTIFLFENSLQGTIPIQYFTEMTNLGNVDLSKNALSGSIPTEIGLLSDLFYLDVHNNLFTGSIPTELGKLKLLNTVWLKNNNFKGTVPTELAQIKNLQNLYLTGNDLLSGSIPEELCSLASLTTIEISCGFPCNCCVDDCVTESPSRSPVILGPEKETLRTLLMSVAFDGGSALDTEATPQNQAFQWLGSSNSTAAFSDQELIERYALATFYFATSGDKWIAKGDWLSTSSVCAWFGTDGSGCIEGVFRSLILRENALVGSFPVELAHISTLRTIDLTRNALVSTIPLEYFENLELGLLDLFSNDITGTLPTELGLQTSLRVLDLFGNGITGTLPTELGLQTSLIYIDIDSNSFDGSIPSQIGQLVVMQTMWLNSNLFTGSIPTEMAQLPNLMNVYLLGNLLTGVVPDRLCDLNLVDFKVDCDLSCACCNNICGGGVTRPPAAPQTSLPSVSPSPSSPAARIQYLLSLASFDDGMTLSTEGTPQNQALKWLLGSPSSKILSDERLVQRYALATLYFSTGGPSWNKKGTWLTDVDECLWFSSEDGEAVCTNEAINQINLHNNNMLGSLPPELGLLSKIQLFDVFNNELFGSIPTQFGLLTDLEFSGDFDSNSLTGTLPTELGALSKVTIFWFNDNLLTGTVPTQLGLMVNLDQLYLHQNIGLTGSIPSELCALNVSTLQVDCATLTCSCCSPSCNATVAPTADPASK